MILFSIKLIKKCIVASIATTYTQNNKMLLHDVFFVRNKYNVYDVECEYVNTISIEDNALKSLVVHYDVKQ